MKEGNTLTYWKPLTCDYWVVCDPDNRAWIAGKYSGRVQWIRGWRGPEVGVGMSVPLPVSHVGWCRQCQPPMALWPDYLRIPQLWSGPGIGKVLSHLGGILLIE